MRLALVIRVDLDPAVLPHWPCISPLPRSSKRIANKDSKSFKQILKVTRRSSQSFVRNDAFRGWVEKVLQAVRAWGRIPV
ncbi:MAG: hypothetical protein JWQ49_4865 [Edaphobacter sp.]|nr:hypothetical protein [Edaphobacter sp.]